MRRRAALALLASLVLAACGGDSGTNPTTNASVAGTYSLKTVNGAPLPYLLQQSGADKEELLSDIFILSDNGTFTETATERWTLSGAVTTQTYPDAGTYTLNGNTITLRFSSDNSTGTATIGDGTMTVSTSGFIVVYAR